MGCSPPGSSVHGILQAGSGLPDPPPGGLPNPGIEPMSPSPTLAGGFVTTSTTWGEHSISLLFVLLLLVTAHLLGYEL